MMARVGIALIALGALPAGRAGAQDLGPTKTATAEPGDGGRKGCFSIGVMGMRHSLKSGGSDEMIGNSAAVQLGSAYIAESYYVAGSVDILLGPNEPAFDKQVNVDFVGTGISVWSGFSAQNRNLRSNEGGYGFALGLSYSDSVGRSVGPNRRDPGGHYDENNEGLIDNYVLRVSNLALMPAMFFSWLQPARPRGNTPDLLLTRLEGYFLTIGMALPLSASYAVRYETRDHPDPDDPKKRKKGEPETDKGSLRGYTIQMAVTAMLGT